MLADRHHAFFATVRSWSALLGSVLVVILGVLAVRPDLHDWVHGNPRDAVHSAAALCDGGHEPLDHASDEPDEHPSDEGCVVFLFAQGVDGGALGGSLVVAALVHVESGPPPSDELLLIEAGFLQRPSRGPPLTA